MRRRTGMTLIEVLVAIFIMAIGLLALLTLFPIGMLRMMQGIRDARSAQSAGNAHSTAIFQNIRNDPFVTTDGVVPNFFKNPLPGVLTDADDWGESYPVFVDPIGYQATPAGTAPQDWVGGYPGALRRRPVQFAVTPLTIYKNFTLWDDINFDKTIIPGTPETIASGISRDTRFAWGYVFKRPQTRDPSIVDCSVVVFDQRSLSLTGTLSLEEYVYANTATFNPANGTVTIDYTANVQPPLRPGDWILDATLFPGPGGGGTANAYFYRVVSSDDVAVNQTMYELQQPIRGYWAAKNPGGYVGTAIVIRGVAEVFEKGPVRLP